MPMLGAREVSSERRVSSGCLFGSRSNVLEDKNWRLVFIEIGSASLVLVEVGHQLRRRKAHSF